MKELIRRKYQEHKGLLKDKRFLLSIAISALFLMVGIIATFFAIIYANERSSNPVTDIILNNIPVIDVDGIFLYGPVVFWILIGLYLLIFEPRRIPFSLKSIALFLVIRSVFVSLTHIGPFPTHTQIDSTGILGVFTSGNDLFFSSHTGMPFLMALVFWNNKYVRYFCLILSVIFGAVVLLAHLHYSIDVFAAFFITYSIYIIATKFFKKDLSAVNDV